MITGKQYKNYNDIFNLDGLVCYWSMELMGRMQRLFVWEGLPFPQRELENLTMSNGISSFVKNKKFLVSQHAVVPCTYSGVTEYPDIGTTVKWTTPVVNGSYKMQSTDGVLIRNNSLSIGVIPFITRYAVMLANTDISLVQALVNERDQSLIMANNQPTVDAINSVFKKLEQGQRRAVLMDNLFQSVQGAISLPTVSNKDTIKPILNAYDTILQMFYNDIGIRYNKDKKERMVESEVTSDSQRLLMNISDMLECRKKASEEINNYFGLNTSVRLSNEIVLAENNQTNESNKTDSIRTAEDAKEFVDYEF